MLARLRRRGLFAQSASLFIALVFALQVVSIGASFLLVVKPLLRASVRDVSAVILLSARNWAELPPVARPPLIDNVRFQQHLIMTPASDPLTGEPSRLPYIAMLEDALSERTGSTVRVLACANQPDCYVTDVPTRSGPLRFQFTRERIGTSPLLAIAIIFVCGLVIASTGAWCLARCISKPLSRLAGATGKLSRGDMATMLPEDGPRELALLAGDFNRMTGRLRELMENRATMLAGVSHDLRTPITRMRMALELVRRESDPLLLDQMESHLKDMNRLIGQFLHYSRGLRNAPVVSVDVAALLREQVRAQPPGRVVLTAPDSHIVKLPAVPFLRVVQNLIENALHYGAGQAVDIVLEASDAWRLSIEVHDRGPGIPEIAREDVFKPFVRLDTSRDPDISGTGLGLAIVRHICDTYAWQIELLARPGGGTIARFTIDVRQSSDYRPPADT